MSDPSQMRRNYMQAGLLESDLAVHPIEQFTLWFKQAVEANMGEWYEPNAMTLATATPDGVPSARIVLLKGVTPDGLTFFTNYESQKGRELAENPRAAVVFFWAQLERQVRVRGVVERLTREESRVYFATRPRGSRLGARASRQSSVVASREVLENELAEQEKLFGGEGVDMPDYWGGYRLKPDYFEFWQGRPSRMHDRLVYRLEGGLWKVERLAP
jgi:pyridoxamine 5'-phosphate oxidase